MSGISIRSAGSDATVTDDSSEVWDEASDQTDAVDEEAEEANDELYGPCGYDEMYRGESSSPQFISGGFEAAGCTGRIPPAAGLCKD